MPFVEAGGNFIDTADVYAGGKSEEILGRWLPGKAREQLVIATKVRFRKGPGANDIGLSRKHILDGVEASLRRMQTDYIDLYQVHCWDNRTPLEETLSTLDQLVKSGKVRYIGASNYAGWQLQKSIDLSRQMGWEPFTCLQAQYNLLTRSMEWELTDVCLNEGLGVIPWSPLRGGWLSGKFHRGMAAPPAESRVETASKMGWSESWQNYNNETTWKILDVLLAVAGEINKSPAQVALRWLMQRPEVTAPIIGARTMEQLKDNLGSIDWELDGEHLRRLTEVSDPGKPYPYWMIDENLR